MAEPEPFEPRGDFVDGDFSLPPATSGEIRLEDPGDLDALDGAFPFERESIDRAVEAARRAYPAWRDVDPEDRAASLRRFAAEISAAEDPLARVIAQEVESVLPELTGEGTDGNLGVSYGRLSAVLVAAMQEQQQTIETLIESNEVLTARIDALESGSLASR